MVGGVLGEGDGAEMDLLFPLSLPPRLSNIITWPWIQLSYNVTMPHPTLARKKVTTNILKKSDWFLLKRRSAHTSHRVFAVLQK